LHAHRSGVPVFLFIVGVSIALGIAPRVESGADLRGIRHAVLVRALRIIGVGLLLNLLAFWLLDKAYFRPWGVLQRIGLCFLAVGWIATWLRPRGQWAVLVALLAAYGLLLAGTGGTSQWINIASRLDTALLGHHVYAFDAASGRGHDPEGLLSTLPSIASVLLGLRAGDWLRHGRSRPLLLAGIAMLALGALLACVQPMIKNLWTPSYALWTAGWAALALWLAHRLVDVSVGRRWAAASA
jgi:predicted acyltransferase